MRIKTLTIENFRSLQNLDVELPQVCAIVGPNNSGKSNILEAIKRVLGAEYGPRASHFSEDDVYLRREELDICIDCSVEPPIEYRKLQKADPIHIHRLSFAYNRYKIGEFAGQRRLEQRCLDAQGQSMTVMTQYAKAGQRPKFEPVVGVPQDVREAIPLIHIGTDRSLRRQLPGANYSLLKRMFEDIDKKLQDPAETVRVTRKGGEEADVPRIDRFKQLIAMAMDLLKTEDFNRLEASIKRNALEQLGLDAKTDDIDLYFTAMSTMDFYKSLDLVIKDHGFPISATEIGEGFQNAIVLAILRAFEETRRSGAILLIEEPEMFLHPQMQRSLYKTLRKIGETNQVIYTTHSPQFVSVPEYGDVLLVRRDGEGTYVQQSALKTDQKRKEKLLKELDPERSELFFARRLLLVEGDTEKLSYPAYATKIPVDLDRAGATIVEAGGKRNLKDFAELAISFRIPTGIVYDKDSSDFANRRDEEKAYNAMLDGFTSEKDDVKVWCVTNKHEDAVRAASGEDKYQTLCQRYPSVTNATRQRLIALDPEMPLPPQIKEILTWLASPTGSRRPPEQQRPTPDRQDRGVATDM